MEANDYKITQVTKFKKVLSVLKLLILVVVIAGIPAYIVMLNPELIERINSLEEAEQFLRGFMVEDDKTPIYWIYFGVQIIQIVVCIIPGQFMNMAAGWMFGFPVAFFISIAGAAAGTTITYYMSKLLGQSAIRILVKPEKFNNFLERLNSERAYIAVFVLYLVPGLPKDVLGYIAGVSNMKFIPFLVLSLIGRTASLAASIMTGSMLNKQIYIGVIILAAAMIMLFIAGFVNRKKLLHYIDNGYARYIKKEDKEDIEDIVPEYKNNNLF